MIPSLEGWPTKAKEAPSPHEVRLAPLDTNPVFQNLGGIVFTSGLHLVFKPYLTHIWPVQSWNKWKTNYQSISVNPDVSVSYQHPLPNSLRTSDRKIQLSSFIIWKRLVLKICESLPKLLLEKVICIINSHRFALPKYKQSALLKSFE